MMNEVMYSITCFDDPIEQSYVQYNLFVVGEGDLLRNSSHSRETDLIDDDANDNYSNYLLLLSKNENTFLNCHDVYYIQNILKGFFAILKL